MEEKLLRAKAQLEIDRYEDYQKLVRTSPHYWSVFRDGLFRDEVLELTGQLGLDDTKDKAIYRALDSIAFLQQYLVGMVDRADMAFKTIQDLDNNLEDYS